LKVLEICKNRDL